MSAEQENAAPFAVTALGWWRPDVPAEVNDAYWRDIHGTLAARIPGFFQHWQLHLATPVSDLRFTGSVDATVAGEPVNGIPQMLFRTATDLQAFGSHPFVTERIFNDERNLARRNLTMPSAPGAARTLIDDTDNPTSGAGRRAVDLCRPASADPPDRSAQLPHASSRTGGAME
jgi:hypothetical protein